MKSKPDDEHQGQDGHVEKQNTIRSSTERFGTKDISSVAHSSAGPLEEHTGLKDGQNDTRATNDHSGTARKNLIDGEGGGADGGELVDVDKIEERFRLTATDRLKPSTAYEYLLTLKHFNTFAQLKGKTKKDLTGQKGKTLILEFLKAKYQKKSWRYSLAKLKTLYICGFGYSSSDWPIEPKRDLPKLPTATPMETPTDDIIRAWDDAMLHEKDPGKRLLWLLIAQHGWRPQHIVLLNWEDVKYKDGNPRAIVARSDEFKTGAPIAAYLAPDVVAVLKEYQKTATGTGQIFHFWDHCEDKPQGLTDTWIKLEKKWGLPYLRPKGLRHWVSRIGKDIAHLSRPALAVLMGHDTKSGSWMSDWYDSPSIETMIDEQMEKMPKGALGFLHPIEVELVNLIPEDQEILELWHRYKVHEIGLREFSDQVETLKNRVQSAIVSSAKIDP